MAEDLYYVPEREGSGQLREKMSRFISFVRKVKSMDEARNIVKEYQNEYHDARHVCWAAMIGSERKEWLANDNGEPSGTAGKPILGQINSAELTDILVVVVRYFGGIKLGTPGLIAAYREAARLAIEDSGKKEMYQMQTLEISFPYMAADGVLKIVKGMGLEILERTFDNTCVMKIAVRKDLMGEASGKILSLSGVTGNIITN